MKPPDNRVLMLLENQAYPQDNRVRREALALARAGYRVSVVCAATRAQVRREVVDGVRVTRVRSPALANGVLGCRRENGSKIVYKALVLFERLACRLADHVIATNESYKEIEIERHNVPAERIIVVRNGVEVPRDRPMPPDSPDHGLRRKGKTIIAFLGVMGFQDGLDYLIRALRHLRYDLGRRDFYCVLM